MTGLRCGSSVAALALGFVAHPSAAAGQTVAPVSPTVSPAPSDQASKSDPAIVKSSSPANQDMTGSPSGGVDDIIVTAQRRAESIQNVPISITAVSGDNLVKSGVTSLDGLQRVAPGVSIATVGSGFVSYTYVRGGGTNQLDPGSDPSVAFFVDEIYIGGTAGLQFDLFDIERVEVLKGPQGTLFGRNASSGAISVITRRPSSTLGANAYVEYGSYNALLARASISGPITSDGSLLARVSGVYRRRDAFTQNLTGGSDPGNIDTGGLRAQLEYRSGDFSFLLTGDALRARNGQTNQFLSTVNTSGWVNGALPQPADRSFYRQYYDLDGFENQDVYDANGRMELGTPVGTLTSISAYRVNKFRRSQDQDATLYNGYVLNSRERDETFSQELRLSGDVSDRLRYVAGLFYYHAKIDSNFTVLAGPAFPTAVVRGRSASDTSEFTTDSYAAFGQATFDFTDQLALTLGGRYTKDDKQNLRSVRGFFATSPFIVNPKPSFDSFDPAITLDFKPREGILAYVSYRTGFKSGGFQSLLPATPLIANTPFLPENVKSYELGLKTTFLDRRVLANIALFRSDIDNQQIGRITGTSTVLIDNAGKTRADGVDLTLVLKPIPELTFSADITAQRARFRRYLNGALNFAGNSQLRSPDFAGYFSTEYAAPLTGLGTLTFRGEYAYKSKVFFDGANSRTSGLYQPDYGVGNLRLSFTPENSQYDVAAFVRNVGKARYYQNIAISGPTGLAVPGEPRVFGGSLNYRFK